MKSRLVNLSLSLLSLLLALLALEIGTRVYYGKLFVFSSFLEYRRDLFRSAYPAEFDRELGWIPRQGSHPRNAWNTKVTILEDGIRSNGGAAPPAGGGIILAVGDSFTFGDQVDDDKTWPARLEATSGTRVINGGVFGYGVDQSYLRMLSLAARYKPKIIVFSFIQNDISRCELSERTSVPKPYFTLSDGDGLVLMNGHIPATKPRVQLDALRRVLGYSLFAHTWMSKAAPEYWFQGPVSKRTKVHADGAAVTCRIFKKLKDYAVAEKVRIIVLVQYRQDEFEEDLGVVDGVLACVDRDVLELVDLRAPLAALKKQDDARYRSLFHSHMTQAGNDFVAALLRQAISRE